MRKIPSYLENPLDNIIINFCDVIAPFFKKLHFTPNGITTLSLIFGLLSIISLYYGHVVLCVIFYFISYIFDTLDGFMARKYNMVTRFGDIYDHIKDWTVFLLLTIVFIYRNKNKLTGFKWFIIIFIFIIFMITQTLYFACQECYYDKMDEIPSMKWITKFISTPAQAEKYLKIIKYYGVGTFVIYIMVIIVCVEYS
jgi:phosphatidylglycerophosphate synthase